MALDWCWYRQSDLNIVVAEAVQLRTEAAAASGRAGMPLDWCGWRLLLLEESSSPG